MLVATVSPELDAVVRRGLAKDPARRFDSCAALMEAAEQALRAGPPVAAPAGDEPGQEWLIRAVVRAGAPRRPVAPAEATAPPPCPYPELRSFEKDDAAWFHGRNRVTTDVLVRLAKQQAGGEPVVLVGASGCRWSRGWRSG